MGRYEIINRSYDEFYEDDCPIILIGRAISKDNEKQSVFIQLKFQNLCTKNISAVYLEIMCEGVSYEHLTGIPEYVYLDLNVPFNGIFGNDVPIYLPDVNSRFVSVKCNKIVYSDQSVWENKVGCNFEKIPEKDLLKNSLNMAQMSELRKIIQQQYIKSDILYVPYQRGSLQRCVCGAYYLSNLESCPKCRKSIAWWKEHISGEYLDESLKEREANEEAQRVKEDEEKERLARLQKIEEERRLEEKQRTRLEKSKKFKKVAKIVIPSVCTVLVIIVASILITRFRTNSILNNYYTQGNNFFDAGNYEDAISNYEKANGYKDSDVKIEEAKKKIEANALYDQINEQFDKGSVDTSTLDALERLKVLGEDKDIPYYLGKYYYLNQEYENAIAQWDQIYDQNAYLDLSGNYHNAECHLIYDEAIDLASNFQMREAYEKLTELDVEISNSEKLKKQFNDAIDNDFVGIWKEISSTSDVDNPKLDTYFIVEPCYYYGSISYFLASHTVDNGAEAPDYDTMLSELSRESGRYILSGDKLIEAGDSIPKMEASLEDGGSYLVRSSEEVEVSNGFQGGAAGTMIVGGNTYKYERVE